jgi:hypothetical protein
MYQISHTEYVTVGTQGRSNALVAAGEQARGGWVLGSVDPNSSIFMVEAEN